MSNVERELVEIEERQWKANREADGAFYQEYCTDDFLLVSQFGVMNLEQLLAGFARGNVNPFLRTDMADPQVRELGPEHALLTYKVTIDASIDAEGGKVRTFSMHATSIYRNTPEGWRFSFTQLTPLQV